MVIKERESTHVYRQKQLFSREELEQKESLCVHEQPPYCNAACPLKLDTKAMMAAIAAGDFTKALQLYDKITPFPHILAAGCEAPCEGKCKLCTLGEGVAVRQLEAARQNSRMQLESLEKGAQERVRAYQTLGVCCGAAIAILLI